MFRSYPHPSRSFLEDLIEEAKPLVEHGRDVVILFDSTGKQDRSIETEATDRLQRDLSRSLGIEAEVEKACGLRAQTRYSGRYL